MIDGIYLIVIWLWRKIGVPNCIYKINVNTFLKKIKGEAFSSHLKLTKNLNGLMKLKKKNWRINTLNW